MTARRLLLVAVNLMLVAGLALALTPSETPDTLPVRAEVHASATPETEATESAPRVSGSRPLFARIQAPAPVEPPKPPAPATPAFRLAGVLWGDAERLAVIQMPDDTGNRRVRLGEAVDEWTLSDITPKTATFSSAGRNATLGLNISQRSATEP